MSVLESSTDISKSDKGEGALRMTQVVVDTVLNSRRDVLARILTLRLSNKTYDTIAEDMKELLAELRVTSEHVRRNVVAVICTKVIHPDVHENIKSHTRHAKKMPPISEAMKAALEKGQTNRRLYRSNEFDVVLLEYARTMLYVSGPNTGKINWPNVAAAMKEHHNLDFTTDQWKRRYERLSNSEAKKKK